MASVIECQDELSGLSLSSIKTQLKALGAQLGITGRLLAFAAGMGKSGMSYWLGQPEARISLSRTISLTQALKIPLLSFFRAQFGEAQIPAFTAARYRYDGEQQRRHVSDSEMNTELEKALRMGETSSSVALKLGVDKSVIRERSPGLYDLVKASNEGLRALKRSMDRRLQINRARARYCELLKDGTRPTARNAGYGGDKRSSTEAAAFQLIRIRLGESHLKMPTKASQFTAEDWECLDRAVQAIKESPATRKHLAIH